MTVDLRPPECRPGIQAVSGRSAPNGILEWGNSNDGFTHYSVALKVEKLLICGCALHSSTISVRDCTLTGGKVQIRL